MSAADDIRRKQRMKHLLAEIVENLKDYFEEVQLEQFGEKSRFVVLNEINSIHKIGSKGLNLVTAEFNSELGSLTLVIAIKKFRDAEEAWRNKILTDQLITKLKNTGIYTPRVIFTHGSTLIYEGIQGASFVDSKIDNRLKLFLAGEALSKFHSAEQKFVDTKRYIYLTKQVLKDLRLPPDRVAKFVERGGNLLDRVLVHPSGINSFGDFHPGNILFSLENSSESGNRNIFTWLIDPEYTEEANADRMEDIGTFFLHEAIDSYLKDDHLKNFGTQIQPFFEGYDRYLSLYGLSLYEIYKGNHELAFSYHLGLNVLLEALFIQKKANLTNKTIFDRWTACIGLANHLWTVGII